MSNTSQQLEIPDGRLTGIDVLRVLATFLVIALHAGVPYLPETMPGLAWTVDGIDPADANPLVTSIFWGIECCIMPLFFVVSGVSTRILLDRRGVKPLFLNRRDRLLKPFLIFGFPILILEFYIWNYGYVLRGELSWKQLLRFDAKDFDPRLWGLAHFWYLQYLFLYTILLILSCHLRGCQQPGTERWFSWGGKYQYFSVLAVTLVWATPFLTLFPNIVADFEHSVLPVAERIFYFGIYFTVGVSLVSSARKHPRLALDTARVLVALAVAGLFLAIPQVRAFLGGPTAPFPELTGAVLAIVALGLSVGLATWFLFWNPTLNPVMKYLSASAYWMYFIHHALCGSLHLILDRVDLPVGSKYLITLGGALSGALLLYQFVIRNRWPEKVFNGRISKTETDSTQAEPNASKQLPPVGQTLT